MNGSQAKGKFHLHAQEMGAEVNIGTALKNIHTNRKKLMECSVQECIEFGAG